MTTFVQLLVDRRGLSVSVDPASPFPRCGAAACRPVSPLAVDVRCRRLFGRCDSRLGLRCGCVGCRRYCCIRLCGWFCDRSVCGCCCLHGTRSGNGRCLRTVCRFYSTPPFLPACIAVVVPAALVGGLLSP